MYLYCENMFQLLDVKNTIIIFIRYFILYRQLASFRNSQYSSKFVNWKYVNDPIKKC